MAELILHHYPTSPFAEKARLLLGSKKLKWHSVMIPVIMPKPDLTCLTGGYRRTPVLQVGADIYCDTALIADFLERLAPSPSLYPAGQEGLARTIAQWADTTLFWTAIAYAFQPAGIQSMFAHLTPEQIKAFGADRAAMRANAPRMAVAEATGALQEYLRRLEGMLAGGNAWLLGEQSSISDFSVYHSLWYVRNNQAVNGILDTSPKLLAWMDRVKAIGHHEFEKMPAEAAIAVARDSEPASTAGMPFVDTHGIALGERVTVTPTDYALDPVEGELVVCAANEFAVRRQDDRAGSVVVHFPRVGFQLKKI